MEVRSWDQHSHNRTGGGPPLALAGLVAPSPGVEPGTSLACGCVATLLPDIRQDLRYGLRSLRHSPTCTAASVFSLPE